MAHCCTGKAEVLCHEIRNRNQTGLTIVIQFSFHLSQASLALLVLTVRRKPLVFVRNLTFAVMTVADPSHTLT